MRSIELTLDPEAEAAVRADWAALLAADLPSLGTHQGASNRPHVTLAAGEDLADSAALRDVMTACLPVPIEFGAVLLFSRPGRPVVLARQVVASSTLLSLHRAVHAAAPDALELTLPDRWTPHVTLAMRMPVADLPRALEVLGVAVGGSAVAARLWDGREKTLTDLGAPPPQDDGRVVS